MNREQLLTLLSQEAILKGKFSNPRRKQEMKHVEFKTFLKGSRSYLQFAAFTATQVFHDNIPQEAAVDKLQDLLASYKQINFETTIGLYQVLVNKKGQVKVYEEKKEKPTVSLPLTHDHQKNYLLQAGVVYPFLEALGITKNGVVKNKHYDKFRQINRYLEIVATTINALSFEKKVRIIDFGCGKGYLTFALYHYLVNNLKKEVELIGVDLKEDVIKANQLLARNLSFKDLHFIVGDIRDYQADGKVDMVISLHACDTATDAGLAKAVGWGAEVILAVPCCQHELFSLLKNDPLNPILSYGYMRDKMATLVTDSLRGLVLNHKGYEVDMMEFIDLEHTPKNMLIRATFKKQLQDNNEALAKYKALKEEFSLGKTAIDDLFDLDW